MRKFTVLFTIIFSFFSASLFSKEKLPLKLKAGKFILPVSNPNENVAELTADFTTQYAVVQFYRIPTEAEKKALKNAGLELLEYLPKNAFIAHLSQPSNTPLKNFNIKSLSPYLSIYKVAPALAQSEKPEWSIRKSNSVALTVEPHLNISKSEFLAFLQNANAEVTYEDANGNYFELILKEEEVEDFAQSEYVKFLDYIAAPPEKEDVRGRTLHRGSRLDSDHPMGRQYDGSGVGIAIADDGTIGPHIDFEGRVSQFTSFDNGTHGDMTSGITVGAGNLNPDHKGMAPGAYLYLYSINGYPHIANAVNNLNNNGIVITSTSYSEGCNAGYTSTARAIDQQVRQNPELLHVFSAGNSASFFCGSNHYGAGTPWGTVTGGRKQGKSTIATANLDYVGRLMASSSRGPAADGRIKPDISAFGNGQISTAPNNSYLNGSGTSAAAPGIAGISAQIYQGYRSLNSGNDPESGLIKSVMLNTANDLGNKGPDFFYGWGHVNAHRAMKLLEENRYLDSSLSQNGQNIHNVTINNNLEELRLMVYWTDYEASTTASQALVNDLDVQVVTPNGDTILPWILDPTPNDSNLSSPATRGVDDLNNMEQVFIDTAASGTYQVIVNGTSVPQGPQKYFLSWETRADEVDLIYPNGGESFTPGTTETIRWDAVGSNGGYRIEYSLNGGSSWNTITITSGTTRSRDWLVPNNVTGDALFKVTKMLSPTISTVSDSSDYPFSIIGVPTNITETFVCFDSTRISWNPVNGATAYEISMLGTNYMDSIGRSSTNSFTIRNLPHNQENWVSVKALGNGIIGKRANARLLSTVIENCPFDYDVGVDRLVSPNELYVFDCGGQGNLGVSVELTNYGDSTLFNVPLSYRLNGILHNDTLSGPLLSDSTVIFTFSDSISLVANSLNTFFLETNLSGDENATNDREDQNFRVFSTSSVTIPVLNDFDNNTNCSTASDCGSTNCNLSNGWLNLTNNQFDDFDMRVTSGSTPSTGTGPSGDHTSGNGKYIYAEASNNCYEVESHVTSPCIDLSGTISPELSFWYHMLGSSSASVGSLEVDIYSNGSWERTVTPSLSGNQGSSWLKRTVDLSDYTGNSIIIRFRITTSNSWSGDIALDDIEITGQPVNIKEVTSSSTFKLYPNPSSGLVSIELEENNGKDILIHDINGRLIKRFRPTSKNFNIDLSSQQKGVYFISMEDYSIREKVIIF